MKDVARLAGVSTSTVSHVINKDRFVSEAIRLRVEDAIRTLNYAPSALAREPEAQPDPYHRDADHRKLKPLFLGAGAWRGA
ncbi:Ribose operon repressor [Cronobacter malonaticus 681]|nr:Ribose operon repressor [Cronobacter malonaticus 681]